MGYVGSRSKATDTWMLRSDESNLGELIASALPEGRWRCSHPGPTPPRHLHATITDAMDCGGIQGFLPLPVGTDPFNGDAEAELQVTRSECLDGVTGRYFRVGRIAVSWFENEVGPAVHEILSNQRDVIWQALREATVPAHLELLDGKPISGKRVGPDALRLIRSEGLLLAPSTGMSRYRLRT